MEIRDHQTGAKYELRIERDAEDAAIVLLDVEEVGVGSLDQWIILPLSVTQAKMVARALNDAANRIVDERVAEGMPGYE